MTSESTHSRKEMTPLFPKCFELFAPPSANYFEENVKWVTCYPSLTTDILPQKISFSFPNNGQEFVDLSRSELYLKLKIVQPDSLRTLPLQPRVNKAGALPIDLIMQTMWENINVSYNGVTVSNSDTWYPYKSLFEYMLQTDDVSKNFQGSFMGSSPDVGYFDQTDTKQGANVVNVNTGLISREKMFKKVKRGPGSAGGLNDTVEYMGKLFADVCNGSTCLLNGVRIDIDLKPKSDEFRLMANPEKVPPAAAGEEATYRETRARIYVEEAKFFVCLVNPDLTTKVEIDKILRVDKKPATYYIPKVKMFQKSIPQGDMQCYVSDLWQGDVPSKIIVGMVSAAAFSGNYQKNPFYFQGFDTRSITFKVGNQTLPTDTMQMDLDGANYLIGLSSMYKVANKTFKDGGIRINRNNYREGYTLWGFNIDPTTNESVGNIGWKKKGQTELDIKFSKSLPETVILLVYGLFSQKIEIDHSRNVELKDIPHSNDS